MDLADPVEVIVTLQGYQAKLAGQVCDYSSLLICPPSHLAAGNAAPSIDFKTRIRCPYARISRRAIAPEQKIVLA